MVPSVPFTVHHPPSTILEPRMPTYKIQHLTHYRYDRPVRESSNQIRIYPYQRPGQETIQHTLTITGEPSINRFIDYWGNQAGWFMVNEPCKQLVIDSNLLVKTYPTAQVPLATSKFADWEVLRGASHNDMHLLDLSQPETMQSGVALRTMVAELQHVRDTPAMFIQRCSEYIFDNFTYRKGITTIETTLDEILELRSGVCQDFAHLLLQILRTEGMPARYVSGYICPNQHDTRGAGATHAWVEVWLPVVGWMGIDPTNNCWVSDQHVTLAVGRHFGDCSPVKGTFKGPANQELSVSVSVAYEDGSRYEDHNLVQSGKEAVEVQQPEAGDGAQQQ